MNYQIANALTNDVLSLRILPTEQCNFRCTYCYESFKLGKMSEDTVNAIVKLVTKRAPTLKRLNIGWFGGEPLLAKDIVLYLSKQFQELSNKYGFEYFGSITTNGYFLNKKLFQELVELGIHSYQISLDGSKEIHNKTRVLMNKEGTFDKIWKNLLDMRMIDSDFNVTIRVHYYAENLKNIQDFSHTLNKNFKNDKRFFIYYRQISNLSNCEIDSLTLYENEEEIKKIQQELNTRSTDIETKSGEEAICYASEVNAYIIRSNASISKCTVCLDEEINIIGKLNDNGELELNQDKARLWSIGLETEDADHLACPYYRLIKPEIVDKVKELV